jgi:hypothetical protein
VGALASKEAMTHHVLAKQEKDDCQDNYKQEMSNSERGWLPSAGVLRIQVSCHQSDLSRCWPSDPHSMTRRFSRRKLGWRQIAQAAVRTLLVIFRPPPGDLTLGIEQILKPAHIQTLFP